MRVVARDLARRLWSCALAASLLVTYGVFFTGDTVSGDNIVQYYQTVQMVDRHRITFSTGEVSAILREHDWGLGTRFGLNRDGTTYSAVYGVGQPLMTLPLFVAARSIRHALHLTQPADMTLWCLNWLVFAVLCVLLIMWACDRLGLPRAWKALVTFAAAFASPIWMYSGVPINLVGEMLVTLAAIDLCLWLDASRGESRGATLAVAAALPAVLTFGMAVRPFMATALPAFVAWFAVSTWRSTEASDVRQHAIAAFTAVLLVGVAATAGFNAYYFGSPTTSAYHELGGVMNFRGAWLYGFTGTFLSPLKSPLYFFPLVVLFPVTLAILLWRKDPIGWFALLYLLPQAYLMPKYSFWDGGPDLFARHWLRIIPIVFVTMVAAIPHLRAHRAARVSFFVAAVLLTALGCRAQLLTVMTDERQVYRLVAAALNPEDQAGREFEYHEPIARLVVGSTLVSRTQQAEVKRPRRFLWFRGTPVPSDRLWAAIAGLAAAAIAVGMFSGPARGRRASAGAG